MSSDISRPIPPSGHYVYFLLDENVPFYVGMGTGQRAFDHERMSRSDRNTFKLNKIRKMFREGRRIEYSFIPCDTKEDAALLEHKLIALLGRNGIDEHGILTNRAEGGCGGRTMTPEQRMAISVHNSHVWANKPKEEIAAINEKIRATKIRNGSWKKPSSWSLSEDNSSRLRAFNAQCRKIVEQLTPDGKIVAVFGSTMEAAEKSGLRTSQGSISNVCNGRQRTAGGFVWRYVD